MANSTERLQFVYEGWEGYHRSLVSAVRPLYENQLSFRLSPEMRSVSEVVWHIAAGRVDWFQRLNAPGSEHLHSEITERTASSKPFDAEELVEWLERTWKMVDATLAQWTVHDLPATFEQPYQGKVYAVSRQWVIWRIMCHDIHHGGQLSELLAAQGIVPLELTILGGHLTEPETIG